MSLTIFEKTLSSQASLWDDFGDCLRNDFEAESKDEQVDESIEIGKGGGANYNVDNTDDCRDAILGATKESDERSNNTCVTTRTSNCDGFETNVGIDFEIGIKTNVEADVKVDGEVIYEIENNANSQIVDEFSEETNSEDVRFTGDRNVAVG